MNNEKDISTYLVQLHPLEPFFFGTESNFGLGKNTNYLVNSGLFPQQTTILGMLRFELLINNGFIANASDSINPEDEDRVKRVIGAKGFMVNQNQKKYGIINKLSHVFLMNNGRYFEPNPFDHSLKVKFKKGRTHVNGYERANTFIMPNFNSKEGISELLISNNGDVVNQENIFQKVSRIGIRKRDRTLDESEAFYKQVFRKLAKGFSFAFYVQIKPEEGVKLFPREAVIQMGKEKSLFLMKCMPANWHDDYQRRIEQHFLPNENAASSLAYTKTILLNDTYLEEGELQTLFNSSQLVLNESKDFRFIYSEVGETRSYHRLRSMEGDNSNKARVRSKKYNLIKRGSVFYHEKERQEELAQALESAEEFRRIGYNQYVTLNQS